jgi:hypothetical protein
MLPTRCVAVRTPTEMSYGGVVRIEYKRRERRGRRREGGEEV